MLSISNQSNFISKNVLSSFISVKLHPSFVLYVVGKRRGISEKWQTSCTWFKETCPACRAVNAAWILLAISDSDCFGLGDGLLMAPLSDLASKSKGDLRLNLFGGGSSQEGSLIEEEGGLWGEKIPPPLPSSGICASAFCLIWTGGDLRRRLASETTTSSAIPSLLPSLLEAFSTSSILAEESLILCLPLLPDAVMAAPMAVDAVSWRLLLLLSLASLKESKIH